MPDKRITELDALTAVDDSDVLAIVDDPGGTAVTKKITALNLVNFEGLTDYSGTSTVTGFSGSPSVDLDYVVIGKLVLVWFYITGTSDATTFTFTVPYSAAHASYNTMIFTDNSTPSVNPGKIDLQSASSTVILYAGLNVANDAWTNSNTKAAYGQFCYMKS